MNLHKTLSKKKKKKNFGSQTARMTNATHFLFFSRILFGKQDGCLWEERNWIKFGEIQDGAWQGVSLKMCARVSHLQIG